MSEVTDISLLSELLDKAVKKAVYDGLLKVCKDQMKDDPQAFVDKFFPKNEGCLSPQISQMEQSKIAPYSSNKKLTDDATVALLVTFSPDPSLQLDFLQLDGLARKLCKPSKGVEHSIYSIEQRSVVEEEAGAGAHFHAVLVLNKKEQMGQPARQMRRIVNMFASYQTTTTHFLQVKKVSKEKLIDKIAYVSGDKVDEEKMAKVAIDRLWRESYSAPDFVEL